MSPDWGRSAFILAALVVVGWFAIGTQWNIRRGHRLLRWLQDGLPVLGAKTTLRWLGSSAVELKVADARAPLRSAEVFLVLEPRDLPILWWLFRARGRRDLLIVRGELRGTPPLEFEALDPSAWSPRGLAGVPSPRRRPRRSPPTCGVGPISPPGSCRSPSSPSSAWCASRCTRAPPIWKCSGTWPGGRRLPPAACSRRCTGWQQSCSGRSPGLSRPPARARRAAAWRGSSSTIPTRRRR